MRAPHRNGSGTAACLLLLVVAAAVSQAQSAFELTQAEQLEYTQLTQVTCDSLAGVVRGVVNNAYTVPLVPMRLQLVCQRPYSVNTLSLGSLPVGRSNTFSIPPGQGGLAGRECRTVLEGWDPYSSSGTPGNIITMDTKDVIGCGPFTDFSELDDGGSRSLCDADDPVCQIDNGELRGSWIITIFIVLVVSTGSSIAIVTPAITWLTEQSANAGVDMKRNGGVANAQKLQLKRLVGV